VTEEADRTRWMGMIGASFAVGFTLGPPLGGLLTRVGDSAPMEFAAGLAGMNFVWAWLRLREPGQHASAEASGFTSRFDVLRQPDIARLCLVYFLFTLAVTQLETTFAFYMSHRFGFDELGVAMVMLAMAIVMGGILVRLDQGGELGGFRAEAPALVWGLSVLLFSVSALVQNLAARRLRAALARARSSEAQYRRLVGELEVKNAELERFTYTVSHDLKSPLITIRGFLGFVEQDAEAGRVERVRSDLARIRDAVDKMQRLLAELLDLSRVGRVIRPSQAVALGPLAREAVSLVAGRLREQRVEVAVADDLPTVWGDRERLLEVLQNLLDNAAKFIGGQQQPRIEVGTRRDGGERVVFVRDNGQGIDERFRDRVFGLFEKLDPASEGSGVGLALVKRIVDLHQGRVWIESEGAGRGTTVCFTLPGAPAGS